MWRHLKLLYTCYVTLYTCWHLFIRWRQWPRQLLVLYINYSVNLSIFLRSSSLCHVVLRTPGNVTDISEQYNVLFHAAPRVYADKFREIRLKVLRFSLAQLKWIAEIWRCCSVSDVSSWAMKMTALRSFEAPGTIYLKTVHYLRRQEFSRS
jgi:hypothetical protein